MSISFVPSEQMARLSKEALKNARYLGYTDSVRVKKIANLEPIHITDVLAINNFFVRHLDLILKKDCAEEIRNKWAAYGGESGFGWCKKTISKYRQRKISEDKSVMYSINLPEHPELIRIQKRLKALLPHSAVYNNPETFHMTLLYIPEPPDDETIKNITIENISSRVFIMSGRFWAFETSDDGYAVVLLVEKTVPIAEIQNQIFSQVARMGIEVSPYSIPENYTPHITLAYVPYSENMPDLTDVKVNFSAQAIMCELERWGEIIETYPLVF